MTDFSPAQYVCFKLNRAMRKVHRNYEANLGPIGITPVQSYVLSCLLETNGIKFKTLAAKLSMDGPTLTGTLDRLERMGYVERQDDPDDRRSLLIFTTAKMEAVKEEFIKIVLRLDGELRNQFDKKDFATFLEILDIVGKD